MEFNYDQINIKLIKIMFAYKQVCLNKKIRNIGEHRKKSCTLNNATTICNIYEIINLTYILHFSFQLFYHVSDVYYWT